MVVLIRFGQRDIESVQGHQPISITSGSSHVKKYMSMLIILVKDKATENIYKYEIKKCKNITILKIKIYLNTTKLNIKLLLK